MLAASPRPFEASGVSSAGFVTENDTLWLFSILPTFPYNQPDVFIIFVYETPDYPGKAYIMISYKLKSDTHTQEVRLS